jgi:uridine phosphorylase
MSLPASELVLNADGSIYHLAMQPDDVADLVLTVGDPGRVSKVARHFDSVESEREKREFRSCTGWLGGQRITVLSTGIGTDNIDIALNELDALVNIDLETRLPKATLRSLRIIRLGTSGSLQEDVPVGSLVLSSHGLGLDGLMEYYQAPDSIVQWPEGMEQFPLKPYLCAADPDLLAQFGPTFTRGITATCPGFYGPQGRRLRLEPTLPDLPLLLSRLRFGADRVTNFEMETAAIYGLGALLGHRCLSVNVILANRITGEFAPSPGAAVEGLIQTVLGQLG